MPMLNNRIARAPLAFALVLGGLGLSACATTDYVDERIAAVNSRIDAVDARAQGAQQRADAAASSAEAASASGQTTNQRLDQLTARVERLEQMPAPRTPRN